MSLEIIVTIATVGLAILAIVVTVWSTNKGTRRILEGYSKDTRRILERLTTVVERVDCSIEKLGTLMEGMDCSTKKIAHGMRANALMHGWKYAENIKSEVDAEKLGKIYDYEPTLKTCYYKPRRGRPSKAA